MLRTRGLQRLLALFFAAMMALNYPLLALWDPQASVFGLPLFPTALFLLWAIHTLGQARAAAARTYYAGVNY